jgi:rSAM/selenodomain-associated transferase 2
LRLSVIVPIWNEESALPLLLAELRDQCAVPDCELVLVDGGSTDGTQRLLRESGVAWIVSERGRATQMNAGAAASGAEVLLFLHADTQLPADWKAIVFEAIESGHVGGFFRVRLDSPRSILRVVGQLITLRSRLTGVATGDQGLFVTRQVFESTGGYAPLPLFEDVELTQRLKRFGSLARLDATVMTSARRWEHLGPWRTIVRMWILRAMYTLGTGPERLARYYETAR